MMRGFNKNTLYEGENSFDKELEITAELIKKGRIYTIL